MTQCCKFNVHLEFKDEDCNIQPVAGFTDLRITPKCLIAGRTLSAVSPRVVSAITMITPLTDFFYKVRVKKEGAKHDSEWDYDIETSNKTYTESIIGEIDQKSFAIFDALQDFHGIEVVLLGKEQGEFGNWRMVGFEGDLWFKKINDTTGMKKNESKLITFEISGILSNRWFYVFDTDLPTTLTLVDGITAP